MRKFSKGIASHNCTLVFDSLCQNFEIEKAVETVGSTQAQLFGASCAVVRLIATTTTTTSTAAGGVCEEGEKAAAALVIVGGGESGVSQLRAAAAATTAVGNVAIRVRLAKVTRCS